MAHSFSNIDIEDLDNVRMQFNFHNLINSPSSAITAIILFYYHGTIQI